MEAVIKKIIQAALQAPSGENAQPWRFRVVENKIHLFHDPQSDQSLYNFNNYGGLVCEGAAIENMAIAAHALGKEAAISLFPDTNDSNLIAIITITDSSSAQNSEEMSLYEKISTRTTNRKKFSKKPIEKSVAEALERTAAPFKEAGIFFKRITDVKDMKRLAPVASANEQIMLGNKELHHFFFSHLTWTEKEDAKKKVGFYIKTLELPPPVQLLFKVFAHWPIMTFLKKIGFLAIVGKGNAETYASSAEFGLINVKTLDNTSFINVGRLFERLWLLSEANGLSLQPLTGTIFMNFFAENIPLGHFSKSERLFLKSKMAILKEVSAAADVTPVILYRLGHASPPSARATRYALEDLLV